MWIDTHAHLDFPQLADDLDGVIARASLAGVHQMCAISVDLASCGRILDLSTRYRGIHPVVGIHPCYVDEAPDDIRSRLREMARNPRVAALGETGLDHYHKPSRDGGTIEDDQRHAARQVSLFRQHLEVAAELGLGCVIHTRESFGATMEIWEPFARRVPAVFHCFSGTAAEVKSITDLGGYVSFTGILTFKNAQNIREAIAAVPADRYMLETDSPYLAPVPHRGARCEPAFVAITGAAAAVARGVSLSQVAAETSANAARFFRGLNLHNPQHVVT